MQQARRVLGIDSRALALFRMLFGFLVACDALERLFVSGLLYSDSGLVPRASVLHSERAGTLSMCVFLVNGSGLFGALLLVALVLFSLCFAFGWRTTLSGTLTWCLLVGVHLRNPYVVDNGDVYLRCVLFFALFLPLGKHLSVDAGRKRWARLLDGHSSPSAEQPTHVLSVASVALIVQVLAIYFFGSLLKGEEWTSGTAVFALLSGKFRQSWLGGLLLHFPEFLAFVSRLVPKWEFWSCILWLLPFESTKAVVALLIMASHLLFVMVVRLDMLFWSPFFAAVLLVPPLFWDGVLGARNSFVRLHVNEAHWFSARVLFVFHTFLLSAAAVKLEEDKDQRSSWLVVSRENGARLEGVDALEHLCFCSVFPPMWVCGMLLKWAPAGYVGRLFVALNSLRDNAGFLKKRDSLVLSPQRKLPKVGGKLAKHAALSVVVLVFLWFVIGTNTFGFSKDGVWSGVGDLAALHQEWSMFENPMWVYNWYRVRGNTLEGDFADLGESSLLNWVVHDPSVSEPRDLRVHFGNRFLYLFLRSAFNTNVGESRERFAEFLCANFNSKQDFAKKMDRLEIQILTQPMTGTPPSQVQAVLHKCSALSLATSYTTVTARFESVVVATVRPGKVSLEAPWKDLIRPAGALPLQASFANKPSPLKLLQEKWATRKTRETTTSTTITMTTSEESSTTPAPTSKAGGGKWVLGKWVAAESQ